MPATAQERYPAANTGFQKKSFAGWNEPWAHEESNCLEYGFPASRSTLDYIPQNSKQILYAAEQLACCVSQQC